MSHNLPPLAWQSAFPYDPQRFEPVLDIPGWSMKPHGGLWASPLLPDGGTHWTEWCHQNEYGNPEAPLRPVTADPAATVYVIDDLADLVRLATWYPVNDQIRMSMVSGVSWAKAAAEMDAIWLTRRGEHLTRFTQPTLYGWDCETVLWLQPRFTVGAAE